MKKILSLVLLIFFIPVILFAAVRPNSQKGIYGCSSLTGGAQGSLDALDQTGDGDTDIADGTPNQYDLIDGDFAIVGTISGSDTSLYFYVYDADGTDAESSPEVIRPDDYGSSGVWRLAQYFMQGATYSRTSNPYYCFGDSDTTDSDNNVCFSVNCTDTGSGTEDCDLTVQVQIAGVLTDVMTFDADGNISFSNISLALGTPVSGTLTNCTGLPQSGTVGLTTSDSPQFAGINIGNASDTTLTRVSAGVAAIEGNQIQTGTDDDVPESGDFGNAVALESDGSLSADAVQFAAIDDDGNFGPFTGTWEWNSPFKFYSTTSGDQTIAAAQLGLKTDEDLIVTHGGANGEVQDEVGISLLQHISFSMDPSYMYDQESTYRSVPLMVIGDDFPHGFTITEWSVAYVGGDPTTELDADLICDTTPDYNTAAGATVMDVLDTTAGSSSADTGFDSATCANGSTLYIHFGADPTDANVVVTFNLWGYTEED